MRKVHVINEDYEHYRKRRTRENYLSDLKFLIIIGAFMLIASYFIRSILMGFVGFIVLVIGLFFVKGELGFTEKRFISKWYPVGLIVLSIAFAAFKMFMLNYEEGSTPGRVYSFIDWLIGGPMLIAIFVLIFRGIKKLTRRK